MEEGGCRMVGLLDEAVEVSHQVAIGRQRKQFPVPLLLVNGDLLGLYQRLIDRV
jgi:hypothetical protein